MIIALAGVVGFHELLAQLRVLDLVPEYQERLGLL